MKTTFLLCVSVGLLLTFGRGNRAQAVPVTYTYIGSNYTQTNAPNEPGFTLSDHIIATITLDSVDWGTTVNSPPGSSGVINSGPWQVGTDSFHVTTDLAGTIIAWNLSGAIPGLDIATGGSSDGSGFDTIFGDRPSGGSVFYQASVQYQAGPRPPGTGWTMVPIPDEASSLLLLLLVLVPILYLRHVRYS
jgi:hypothetical protein